MLRLLPALLLLAAGFLPVTAVAESPGAGSVTDEKTITETLRGSANNREGNAWNWAYRVRLSPDIVEVDLPIQFALAPGVSRVAFEERWGLWRREIETAWNNRWAIRFPDGSTRRVRVVVRESPQDHLQRVVVWPGRGRTNMLNWYLSDNGRVIAHEIGHLMGIEDEEYRADGARETTSVKTEAVMGHNRNREGVARKVHLERLRNWVEGTTGQLPLEIVANGSG